MKCDSNFRGPTDWIEVNIGPEVESAVVARLFTDALAYGWDDLSPRKRSRHYEEWVADPQVGGILKRYMSESQARSWIKDGPMKEWARARAGTGRYSGVIPFDQNGPTRLVTMGLGSNWSVEPETLRVKPLRIDAFNGVERVTFAWGPQKDLKHLLWGAIQASADGGPLPWIVAIVDSFTKPVPANVRQRNLRIAERCKVPILHLTL
jgi:hypothetical protein